MTTQKSQMTARTMENRSTKYGLHLVLLVASVALLLLVVYRYWNAHSDPLTEIEFLNSIKIKASANDQNFITSVTYDERDLHGPPLLWTHSDYLVTPTSRQLVCQESGILGQSRTKITTPTDLQNRPDWKDAVFRVDYAVYRIKPPTEVGPGKEKPEKGELLFKGTTDSPIEITELQNALEFGDTR